MSIRVPSTNQFAGEFAWRTLLLFLLCFGGFLFNIWATTAGVLSYWQGYLIATLIGYVVFTPLHEAAHQNISGNSNKLRWIDRIIGHLAGAVLFAPYRIFKETHLTHHQFTNIEGKDPDYWVVGNSKITVFFRCATIYPHYLRFFLGGETFKRSSKVRALISLAILIAIAIVLGAATSWLAPLCLWIGPTFTAFTALAYFFDWFPHYPFKDTHRLGNTRNYPSKWFDYPLLFQSYHQIHHMNPRIPFYRYPEGYQVVKEAIAEYHAALSEDAPPSQAS